MTEHPHIHFSPKPYGGKNPREKAKAQYRENLAERLQKFVNENWVEGQPTVYTTHEVMKGAGIDLFDKHAVDLLMITGGGSSNGITI